MRKSNILTLAAYGGSFIYAPENAVTINPGTSITITVTGGLPPFIWESDVKGVTFGDDETEERTNTLSGISCTRGDIGTITVIDSCEREVSGAMEAVASPGAWGACVSGSCVLPGEGTLIVGTDDEFELVDGNIRQFQKIVKVGGAAQTCDELGGPAFLCNSTNACNDGGDDCSGLACEACISYWPAWSGYLVPYIGYVLDEQRYCNWYRNMVLCSQVWTCA